MHNEYWERKYNIRSPVPTEYKDGSRDAREDRRRLSALNAVSVFDVIPKVNVLYEDAKETAVRAGYCHIVEWAASGALFGTLIDRLSEEHLPAPWLPFYSVRAKMMALCFTDPKDAARVKLMVD